MGRRPRIASLLGLILCSAPSLAHADDSIESALHQIAQYSVHPIPPVSADGLTELAAGETLIFKGRDAGLGRKDISVYAMRVVAAPRLLAWLVLMGGNSERDKRYSRVTLNEDEAGGHMRYQHFDLPWPVRDRHWVIQSRKNLKMAEATGGRAWQHHWDLVDDVSTLIDYAAKDPTIREITPERARSAVIPTFNGGAWSTAVLENGRTLLVARFNFDPGTNVPKSMLRSAGRGELEKAMRRVDDLTRTVHLAYKADPVLHDGFGHEITVDDAERAAASWQAELRVAMRATDQGP